MAEKEKSKALTDSTPSGLAAAVEAPKESASDEEKAAHAAKAQAVYLKARRG